MYRKPFTHDLVFKYVMKQNKDILKTIISSVTKIQVIDMVFLDPNQEKNVYIKRQISDLVLKVNDQYLFNIELDNKRNNCKNSLYCGNLLGNQLNKKDDYKKVKPVIQIVLANYRHFKKTKDGKNEVCFMDAYQQIDNLYSRKWVINLPFIAKSCYNKRKEELTDFERIIMILKSTDLEKMKKIAKGRRIIEKMVKDYEIATEKSELMDRMLQYDYDAFQRQVDLSEAHEKGMIKGEKYGKEYGKREIAKKMLAKGYEITTISEITNLNKNYIASLK